MSMMLHDLSHVANFQSTLNWTEENSRTRDPACPVINYGTERTRDPRKKRGLRNEGWCILINRLLSKYYLEKLFPPVRKRISTLCALATMKKFIDLKNPFVSFENSQTIRNRIFLFFIYIDNNRIIYVNNRIFD